MAIKNKWAGKAIPVTSREEREKVMTEIFDQGGEFLDSDTSPTGVGMCTVTYLYFRVPKAPEKKNAKRKAKTSNS